MHPVLAPALAVVFAAVTVAAPRAEMIGGNPGPAQNYVCPHADGKPPLDCYLDAVEHLYKMCVNVKAIEILEFGYEKSTEGTNGAKSESCLDKQKQNIAGPYKAALREVAKSKPTLDALHGLQETWMTAMNSLTWHAGESDSDYKARVAKPYEEFDQRIAAIRTDLVAAQTRPAAKKPVHAAKAKPKAKSKAKSKSVAKSHSAATTKAEAKAGATEAGKH